MALLSINEIRARAAKFSLDWQDACREEAEAQLFQNGFFHIFGVELRKVALFEHKVKCLDDGTGYIDLFWKGQIIIEMKSRGKDREKAYQQARRYADSLPPHEVPHAILICDFEHWDFYDLDKGGQKTSFTLAELPEHIHLFLYLAGYGQREFVEEDPVNVKAAELMGRLHDTLKATGYEGHPLEVYLVRLLFCLFADDTGIFNKDDFLFFIREHTAEDGDDLAARLAELFQVLNTPETKRLKGRNEQLAAFPYINGGLFAEYLPMPAFDSDMRRILLECCALDWGKISPAIFGSMFQSVMKPEERRALGAHYTSERNILKLINPLFMDGLREEFSVLCAEKNTRRRKNKLQAFHDKLASLTFLDPACGCGNFLVVSYRELRLLELDVLKALHTDGQKVLDVADLCKVNVDQFYGIEIEEFPAQIAQVALWLIDHQMNRAVGEYYGQYFARIPLKESATIVCGNALRLDWSEVVPKEKLDYILGNPPFVGASMMSDTQKAEAVDIFGKGKRVNSIDYVGAWYYKAAALMQGTPIRAAFVSTNSITQGEQVEPFWGKLLTAYGLSITFAWRTFKWNNEAKGKAAVHCVIIGFQTGKNNGRRILYMEDGTKQEANNINPYLADAPDVIIKSRNKPLFPDLPQITYGCKPSDGGHLLVTPEERELLLAQNPQLSCCIRRYIGARDFLNGSPIRYCLWFRGIDPEIYRNHAEIRRRLEAVQAFRAASSATPTRVAAETPHLFFSAPQKGGNYLCIPEVSSERRKYIPIGFMGEENIASNKLLILPNSTLWHFGILTSGMHMAWMRAVAGRLKSDYQYSGSIVYNTFPWPEATEERKAAISKLAQAVLDARSLFPSSNLATLYDPLAMPPEILKAHRKLDDAVEKLYRQEPFADDAERVAFLLKRYAALI